MSTKGPSWMREDVSKQKLCQMTENIPLIIWHCLQKYKSRLLWYLHALDWKLGGLLAQEAHPQYPDSLREWLWLECGVFPGRLERAVTKGKPTRWALFLLPCTGSKMRTIKFDTIHRAFMGPYNTWPPNAGLKKGRKKAGKVSVTWKRVDTSDTSRLCAK